MTKREAKRLVLRTAAAILDNDTENLWLREDAQGEPLSGADEVRVRAAFRDLIMELRRRSLRA